MILADTSIWVDHLRRTDADLQALLRSGEVLMHPWIIGELALGGLAPRSETGLLLAELPRTAVAAHEEVLQVIQTHSLARRGIGYIDACLVVAVLLTPGSKLWTRDSKLAAVADDLGLLRP